MATLFIPDVYTRMTTLFIPDVYTRMTTLFIPDVYTRTRMSIRAWLHYLSLMFIRA